MNIVLGKASVASGASVAAPIPDAPTSVTPGAPTGSADSTTVAS